MSLLTMGPHIQLYVDPTTCVFEISKIYRMKREFSLFQVDNPYCVQHIDCENEADCDL